MAVSYFLLQAYSGGNALRINAMEYNGVLEAHTTISALLDLEELFSIIALSGVEIERYLLNVSLDDLITPDDHSNRWLDVRYRTNLLIVSFLNSVQAYHSQRPQLLGLSAELKELIGDVERVYREMHESSFEYRIMEALRNHAQHARLPLGGVEHNRTKEWKDNDDESSGVPSRYRHVTAPYFNVPKILKYPKKINKKVLDELESLDQDSLDARYFIRTYLSQLAVCHETVRELYEENKEHAYARLKGLPDFFTDAMKIDPGDTRHLFIVEIEGEMDPATLMNNIPASKYVGAELCGRLDYALAKWTTLRNFDRMYVSSQLVAKQGWSTGNNRAVWILN